MLSDREMGQNCLQPKRHNRGLVVRQLLTGVCSSRVELARMTGLSKMTVTNIVSELIEQRFVEECEEKCTEVCGRNPIRLQISADAPRVVGLLVLHSRIEAALCTLTLDVVKTETVSFLSLSEEQLPVYACEALDRLLASESGILAIGVAQDVPENLRTFLEERYRLPVVADTIGSSAALAEKLFGAGRDVEDFVYVELMRGLQRGFVPKRCANCGRWFLQTPGASYNYCDQPAPNSEEGKTCREVGSSKSFRAKVLNNEIWAIHQRAYKKYFARTKKGTMTKPDFLAWEMESERLRDEALSEYNRAKTEDEKAAIAERLREELNRQ